MKLLKCDHTRETFGVATPGKLLEWQHPGNVWSGNTHETSGAVTPVKLLKRAATSFETWKRVAGRSVICGAPKTLAVKGQVTGKVR